MEEVLREPVTSTRDPGKFVVIMGQALSSHELFVKVLKKALKMQGIEVKIHDLLTFAYVLLKRFAHSFPLKLPFILIDESM